MCRQQGHANPAIFCTMPRMSKFICLQNVASRLTTPSATSCVVVTTKAPSSFAIPRKSLTIVKCSSDVPGGVSNKRTSRRPQKVSLKICLIKFVFLGPLKMVDEVTMVRIGSVKICVHQRVVMGNKNSKHKLSPLLTFLGI